MNLEKKVYNSSPISPLDRVSYIFEAIINLLNETPRDLQIKESDDKEVKLAKINAISNLQGQKIQAYTELVSGGMSIVQALIQAKVELKKFEAELKIKIDKLKKKESNLSSYEQTLKMALKELQANGEKIFQLIVEKEKYELIDKIIEINNQIVQLMTVFAFLNVESWKDD